MFLKNNLVKNVQFDNFGPSPVANISVKNLLGALFNIQKCPWKPVPPPPQSFDASYAPGDRTNASMHVCEIFENYCPKVSSTSENLQNLAIKVCKD